MDPLATALGQNIRQIRKSQRISQDRLSLLCEIDRSYMGRIERGEVNLTIQKLYRIAGALDCHPKDFLPDPHSLLNI